MGKPTGSEFDREFRKGESNETVSVDRNPVVYKIIFEAS